MKLLFKKIRFQNIVSYGNEMTEIALDEAPATLILGKNGSGKCLDASTQIEIAITDPMTRKKFMKFLKGK